MADNVDGNDEYQFDELDPMTPNTGDDNEAPIAGPGLSEEMQGASAGSNNLKRNVLIVVAAVILIVVVYKFIEGGFSTKSTPLPPAVPTAVTPAPAEPQPIPQTIPEARIPSPEAVTPAAEIKINQSLSTIEVRQQSLGADLSSVNNQLGGISNSLNLMMTKMTELNGVIASLNAKIDEQATIIERLNMPKEHKKTHYIRHRTEGRPKFYLQAVIPGRAWLIATNGATLTVREGTVIAGYGIVKLIDPNQGRVTTSSGQVIRFSQEDS